MIISTRHLAISIVAIICLTLFTPNVSARDFITKPEGGDWTDYNTWYIKDGWNNIPAQQGEIPGENDNVTVDLWSYPQTELHITSAVKAQSVVIGGNATIHMDGGSLTTKRLDINGSGTIVFITDNNSIIVNGDMTTYGDIYGDVSHSNNYFYIAGNYQANIACKWQGITTVFNGQKEQKLTNIYGGDLQFYNLVLDNAPARRIIFDVADNQTISIIVNRNLDLRNGVLYIKKGEETSSCNKKITVNGDVTGSTNSWVYGQLERVMATTDDYIFPVGGQKEAMWFVAKPNTPGQTWAVEGHNVRPADEPFYGCLENKHWEITTSGSGKVGGQFNDYNNVNKIVTLYYNDGTSWHEITDGMTSETISSISFAKENSTDMTATMVAFGIKAAFSSQVSSFRPVSDGPFIWTGRGNTNPASGETWKNSDNWIKPANLPSDHPGYPTENDDAFVSNKFVMGDIVVDGQTYTVSGGFYYKKTDIETSSLGNVKFPMLASAAACKNLVISENASVLLMNGGLTITGNLQTDGIIRAYNDNTLLFKSGVYRKAIRYDAPAVIKNESKTIDSGNSQYQNFEWNWGNDKNYFIKDAKITTTVTLPAMTKVKFCDNNGESIPSLRSDDNPNGEITLTESEYSFILSDEDEAFLNMNNSAIYIRYLGAPDKSLTINSVTVTAPTYYDTDEVITAPHKQTISSATGSKETPLRLIIQDCRLELDNNLGLDVEEFINIDMTGNSSIVLTDGVLRLLGDNDYITTPAISGNFDDNCHIDGSLKISNWSDSSTYPVGSNGHYCPITVSGNNNIVKYVNGRVAPRSTLGQNEMYKKLNAEYWQIIPSDNNNYNITVEKDRTGSKPAQLAYLTAIWGISENWRDCNGNPCYLPLNTTGSFIATYNNIAITYDWTGAVSTDWNDPLNWSSNIVPIGNSEVNITIPSSSRLPIIDNIEAAADIINIGEGATLTIQNGASLMAMNTINLTGDNSGHLVINNTWNNMCNVRASQGFKKSDGTTDADNTVVNLILNTGRFNYIGSATKEGNIDLSGLKSGSKFQLYNVLADTWDGQAVGSDSRFPTNFAQAGRIGSGSNPFAVSQVGTILTTGNFTHSIKASVDPSDGAYFWDMLSNPFMFTFPLDALEYENIDPVLWFRCHDGSAFYTTTTSLVAGLSVPKTQETELTMAPMQTFSVRPYTDGEATLTFNSNKATKLYNSSRLKASKIEKDVLRLTISSEGSNTDETALVFRNIGSFDYTYGDGTKQPLSGKNNIYNIKYGADMAIGLYPTIDQFDGQSISLGLSLDSKSEYGVITATNIDEFNSNAEVYLIDNELSAIVNLREQSSYEFEDFRNGAITDRFELKILLVSKETEDKATCLSAPKSEVSITRLSHNEISVKFVQASASKITVYDASGRPVLRQEATGSQATLNLGNAKGIYIVEVTTGQSSERQKIRVF